jgi:hypothetical protein
MACAALSSRLSTVALTISLSAVTDTSSPVTAMCTDSPTGSRLTIEIASRTSGRSSTIVSFGGSRPREHHQVVDQLAEGVDPSDDVTHDRELAIVGGAARYQDLHRPFDAGERVPDLMGDHGGHLSNPGERRLVAAVVPRPACAP